jgi:hypothetical protein
MVILGKAHILTSCYEDIHNWDPEEPKSVEQNVQVMGRDFPDVGALRTLLRGSVSTWCGCCIKVMSTQYQRNIVINWRYDT